MRCVLSVEAVLDVLIHVDLIDYLVSILLECCCKDDDFVILSHEFDELHATWPYEEEALLTILHVMDQCLIQIQHQSVDLVLLVGLQWWQEGR